MVAESINGITACFLAGCTIFFGRSIVPVESAHAVTSILNQVLAGHTKVTCGVLKIVEPVGAGGKPPEKGVMIAVYAGPVKG